MRVDVPSGVFAASVPAAPDVPAPAPRSGDALPGVRSEVLPPGWLTAAPLSFILVLSLVLSANAGPAIMMTANNPAHAQGIDSRMDSSFVIVGGRDARCQGNVLKVRVFRPLINSRGLTDRQRTAIGKVLRKSPSELLARRQHCLNATKEK